MSARGSGTVGCVVVTHNSESVLDACLRSLSVQPEVGDIVVVDSLSAKPDRSRIIAARHGARFIASDINLGYGRSANLGAATFGQDIQFVAVCNPDAVAARGSLAPLTKALAADEGVAVVGPQLLNEDGTAYPAARQFPRLGIGIGHALFVRIWPSNPWTRTYHNASLKPDETARVDWVSGAFMLFRRFAFESVSGFDPAYFMYFEDVDICLRLGRSGWTTLFVPESQVTHSGAHSTTDRSSHMVQVHHESAAIFLSRLLPGKRHALSRWALGIGLRTRSRLVA